MNNLEKFQHMGEELEHRLRLKSFPLAIKLLENDEPIPKEAKRPLKDFGHHLSLCQSFQISRREGTAIAMLREDMWCFEPVVGYGLEPPSDSFLEGYNRYPHDVKTLEAGKHYAEEFPTLETGKYKGVVSTALRNTSFEPDVVMIYADSAQLSLLLLGREYKKGYNLSCQLSAHAACVYGVVPVIEKNKCQVAVPCRGDRYHAMASDAEIIFSVPKEKVEDLMEGLRHLETTGSKFPKGRTLRPEYPLPESYENIAKEMEYFKATGSQEEEKEEKLSSWHE